MRDRVERLAAAEEATKLKLKASHFLLHGAVALCQLLIISLLPCQFGLQ